MIYFRILFLIFLFAGVESSKAQITASDIVINADEMIREANDLIYLKKNVQLIFNDHYLSADSATIHIKNKRIEAEGNVVLQNAKSYIEAEKIIYDYGSAVGQIFNGFVQSGQVVFSSSYIKKKGDDEFEARDATYTTCKNCPPSWSFTGSKIEAKIGGYAKIKYPVLRIGNIPVLILPALVFPLKSKRQSGLLTPSFEVSGDNGWAISQSYFLTVGRSKDLTLTGTHYNKRGAKGDLEYRYVLNPTSHGVINTGYIYDKLFTEDGDTDDPTRENRFYLKYNHYLEMDEGYIHRASLKYISDLRYLRDFAEDVQEPGDAALENRLSVTKNWVDQHLSAEAVFNINLLKKDAFASNDDAVHRFPEVKYSVISQEIKESGFIVDLDVHYTNFNRRSLGYDDMCTAGETNCNYDLDDLNEPPVPAASDPDPDSIDEKRVNQTRDGDFNPDKDIIRTGHRLLVSPSLSYPFFIKDYFSIVPKVTYHEAQYRFNSLSNAQGISESAARRYIETDLSIKTEFSRIYGEPEQWGASSYKHIIEPEIAYSNIPWIRRPDHQFFGEFEDQPYRRSLEEVSNNDVFGDNGLQFDYRDRVFDKKLLRIGFTNRIMRKSWAQAKPVYKEILAFHLSQAYDFDEADRSDPKPWTTIDGLLKVRMTNVDIYSTLSYYPYAQVLNNSSRVKLTNDSGNYFQLVYTEDFNVDNNDNFVRDERTQEAGFDMGFSSRVFNLQGGIRHSLIEEKLQTWHANLVYKPPGECWIIGVKAHQAIGRNDSTYKIIFNFDFGKGS